MSERSKTSAVPVLPDTGQSAACPGTPAPPVPETTTARSAAPDVVRDVLRQVGRRGSAGRDRRSTHRRPGRRSAPRRAGCARRHRWRSRHTRPPSAAGSSRRRPGRWRSWPRRPARNWAPLAQFSFASDDEVCRPRRVRARHLRVARLRPGARLVPGLLPDRALPRPVRDAAGALARQVDAGAAAEPEVARPSR